MEVSESFHCQWKRKLPLLPIAASTHIFRGSFHELPYTPTYFHLPLRVLQTSSFFHKTSIRVLQLPFGRLPWKFPVTSFYMEVGGRRFTCMEFSMELWKFPWKLVEVDYFMDVSRSFHGSTWHFPLSVEVEASIACINCSFHQHIP